MLRTHAEVGAIALGAVPGLGPRCTLALEGKLYSCLGPSVRPPVLSCLEQPIEGAQAASHWLKFWGLIGCRSRVMEVFF